MTTAFTVYPRRAVANAAQQTAYSFNGAFGEAPDRHTEAGGLAAARFSISIHTEGSGRPDEQPEPSPAGRPDMPRPAAASTLGATRTQRGKPARLRWVRQGMVSGVPTNSRKEGNGASRLPDPDTRDICVGRIMSLTEKAKNEWKEDKTCETQNKEQNNEQFKHPLDWVAFGAVALITLYLIWRVLH